MLSRNRSRSEIHRARRRMVVRGRRTWPAASRPRRAICVSRPAIASGPRPSPRPRGQHRSSRRSRMQSGGERLLRTRFSATTSRPTCERTGAGNAGRRWVTDAGVGACCQERLSVRLKASGQHHWHHRKWWCRRCHPHAPAGHRRHAREGRRKTEGRNIGDPWLQRFGASGDRFATS